MPVMARMRARKRRAPSKFVRFNDSQLISRPSELRLSFPADIAHQASRLLRFDGRRQMRIAVLWTAKEVSVPSSRVAGQRLLAQQKDG